MTPIEKHEKAIKILLAIQECENRVLSYNKTIQKQIHNDWMNLTKYYTNRIKITYKIQRKLENYYNLNFRL